MPRRNRHYTLMQPEKNAIEKQPAWMLTFADIAALLLAFFVLLFSMTASQIEKLEQVVSSIVNLQDPLVQETVTAVSDKSMAQVSIGRALPLSYVERILAEKLNRSGAFEYMRMNRIDDELILSIEGNFLFQGREISVRPERLEFMTFLALILEPLGNRIDVVSHLSPNMTAKLDEDPGGWLFSLDRALSFRQLLQKSGYTENIHATTMGDSRGEVLSSELSAAEREKLANRIDLVIRPDQRG